MSQYNAPSTFVSNEAGLSQQKESQYLDQSEAPPNGSEYENDVLRNNQYGDRDAIAGQEDLQEDQYQNGEDADLQYQQSKSQGQPLYENDQQGQHVNGGNYARNLTTEGASADLGSAEYRPTNAQGLINGQKVGAHPNGNSRQQDHIGDDDYENGEDLDPKLRRMMEEAQLTHHRSQARGGVSNDRSGLGATGHGQSAYPAGIPRSQSLYPPGAQTHGAQSHGAIRRGPAQGSGEPRGAFNYPGAAPGASHHEILHENMLHHAELAAAGENTPQHWESMLRVFNWFGGTKLREHGVARTKPHPHTPK